DCFTRPLKLSHYSFNKDDYRNTASVINENITVDTGAFKRNITGATLDILCFYPTFPSSTMQKLHFNIVKVFRSLLIVKGELYLRDNYSLKMEKLLKVSSFIMRIIPKKLLLLFLNIGET